MFGLALRVILLLEWFHSQLPGISCASVVVVRFQSRYSAVTVMGLIREVARCDIARLDWNVLVKKLNAGISSARECQALWRHLAYRAELNDFYPDDEQPPDDDSDLEVELLPSPAVSAEANLEVIRWVKTDMQRFGISGRIKGDRLGKFESRDAGLTTDSNQVLCNNSMDGSHKGASISPIVAAGGSTTTSPQSGTACPVSLATPGCTLPKAALGQLERKKRKLWSLEEDQELISAVEKFGEGNWTNILKGSFTHKRTAAQLSQRWALIRKRREIQATANRAAFSASAENGNGVQLSIGDRNHETSPAQNARTSQVVLPSVRVENDGKEYTLAPTTAMTLIPTYSGCQSQDLGSSVPNAFLSGGGVNGVNGASNASIATCGAMDSVVLPKGEVGTSMQSGTNGGGHWQTLAGGAAGSARSNAGSLIAVAAMAVGQAQSVSAKIATASVRAGRLIAPSGVVMSAVAAQAASVGVSDTWQAATLATTASMTSGPVKYVVRSNSGVPGGWVMSSKVMTGPDPGVKAAAVAAGARIAPASTAASLLKAAQCGNVVHIRPGGVTLTKSGLSSQTGIGHNSSGGSQGSSGAIVHYITTGASAPLPNLPGATLSGQRPAQLTKNQAAKLTTVVAANGSICPSASNPTPEPK